MVKRVENPVDNLENHILSIPSSLFGLNTLYIERNLGKHPLFLTGAFQGAKKARFKNLEKKAEIMGTFWGSRRLNEKKGGSKQAA